MPCDVLEERRNRARVKSIAWHRAAWQGAAGQSSQRHSELAGPLCRQRLAIYSALGAVGARTVEEVLQLALLDESPGHLAVIERHECIAFMQHKSDSPLDSMR